MAFPVGPPVSSQQLRAGEQTATGSGQAQAREPRARGAGAHSPQTAQDPLHTSQHGAEVWAQQLLLPAAIPAGWRAPGDQGPCSQWDLHARTEPAHSGNQAPGSGCSPEAPRNEHRSQTLRVPGQMG